jgi:hypothetical protein
MEEGAGMHRRSLVLRRFGAMSFGLGYYEDGVWVDHAADGDDGGAEETGLAWEAIHGWFTCCGSDETAAAAAVGVEESAARGVVRLASS